MGLFDGIGNSFRGFTGWSPTFSSSVPAIGMGNLSSYFGQPNISSIANAANSVANTVGNGSGNGWFNMLFGDNKAGLLSTLGGLGLGIMQGFTGLQQLGLANRALNLANKQFGFQTALANRNLANQAKIINNTYDSAAAAAAGLIGGKDANGRRGFADPTVSKLYADYAKTKHVDGSSIG